MCTVTIVPKPGVAGAWRMACSRDESHGRPLATPPNPAQPVAYGDRMVFMPIDPSSNGTWVAVNDAGLALTLLNYNLPEPPTGRDLSRGSVIPALIGASTVEQVVERAREIEHDRMMPFRLVAFDGETLMLWRGTEAVERAEVGPWSAEPVMWTSSGLGDHLVEGPRRELFDSWFGDDSADYLDQQLAFHRHQWPGREHLSVCMHRDDARTVSYTTLDIDTDRITMTYLPDRPDREVTSVTATLDRRLVKR